ncbi:MAG: hypothetical protein KF773_34430 [Deltaproteobacteria bacterium]|nr:hypothetical protein [Deltaproteobacteria bacterium]
MCESRALARLERETRLSHAEAEADRLSVMTSSIAAATYRSLLVRIHGFEAPLAEALAGVRDLAAHVDVAAHTRIELLEADLGALGVSQPHAHARCTDRMAFASTAVALGWLYVLEHNRVVHPLLERYLAPRLPEPMATASAYLRSPPRRRELGAALEDAAGSDEAAFGQVVYGARFAFRSQRTWYQRAQQHVA